MNDSSRQHFEILMASDRLFGFYYQHSDWLQFRQFPGYINVRLNYSEDKYKEEIKH